MAKGEIQTAPARTIVRDKATLKTLLESGSMQESLKNVASKYLTEDKIVKAALLALSRQPKLANCSTTSFLTSLMKAAQLELEFSGATGQAYLVPYGKDCVLVVGYQGMIEVAYRSKAVEYIDAQLVYAEDTCEFNLGTDPHIKHQPCMDGERGDVKFAYAVVRLKNVSIPKIELMSYQELIRIKNRSMAKDSGPWKTDEAEMMRKTVIRRVFKYIPKTPDILDASQIDNEQYDYGTQQVAEDVKTGVAGLRDRLKDGTPPKVVDSTTKDAPSPEPEPQKTKRGRPKGAKKKANANSVNYAPAAPPPDVEDGMSIDDVQPAPAPLPEETSEQPPQGADKILDSIYKCLRCSHTFDEPMAGKDGVTLCPKCFTKEIIAVADEQN